MNNKHINKITYGAAIREGLAYLLREHPEVFIIGQGLWSPWYVGNTMTNLEKEFGKDRVLDSPVSELACTGAAIGASLNGLKAIVVHPRMDFMILAADQIVNQAAKWRHMLGGKHSSAVTIRGIINRGGEQGAQHSQALHSWYAHIPGLRVVMPATVADARDLLIYSVLCDDPVLYIDDRWLYEQEDIIKPISIVNLETIGPQILNVGEDVTLVGCGYSSFLCNESAKVLNGLEISAEVIDLRVLNPLNVDLVVKSVNKTGLLVVVDGGWKTCGLAGEVIASVIEKVHPCVLKERPVRITLPHAPAPTSLPLEEKYYPKVNDIVNKVKLLISSID